MEEGTFDLDIDGWVGLKYVRMRESILEGSNQMS